MKKSRQRVKRLLLCALSVIMCTAVLTACAGSLEDKLPGSYKVGNHIITFYSDGTYEETYEYGTGTWAILDKTMLKRTDFYGETLTHEISEITDEGVAFVNGMFWERVE